MKQAAALDRPEIAHLCITDQNVGQLLDKCDAIQLAGDISSFEIELSTEELECEELLRADVKEVGRTLPIDYLVEAFELQPFELNAILICASVEIDRAYERIIAFVHDDLNLRFPSVDLLCRLCARELLEARSALGPHGILQASGLLESFGEITTGSRTQLRLGNGVLEFLIGGSGSLVGINNVLKKLPHSRVELQDPKLSRIGEAISAGEIEVVGVWGQESADPMNTVAQIANAANCSVIELGEPAWNEIANTLRKKLLTASIYNALLLIDVSRLLDDRGRDSLGLVTSELTNCKVPIIFIGLHPWRPTELVSARQFVELSLTGNTHADRQQTWSYHLPEIDSIRASSLAARYRMSKDEISAVGNLARASAMIESNGKAGSLSDQIDLACRAVASKASGQYLANVECRRGPSDLVLPEELHRQILEIASFAEALPQVADTWGFGRIASGNLAIKCLFTGDPGTGKTLAAEVIANMLGMSLLKVNLAKIVSKWVGETEKNIDAAFQEASTSHAILFFDEADSLFGKRGEVKQGVDRYANLEVSHLLQRLEEHSGLVILASNLKVNIDSAFLRRFQSVLHFPRPRESERKRIWKIAFPEQAPLAAGIDPTQFSHLDMTGAAIVSAARTAALLASSENRDRIEVSHLVRGIARQFRQEGRVLSPRDLRDHASLLMEAS